MPNLSKRKQAARKRQRKDDGHFDPESHSNVIDLGVEAKDDLDEAINDWDELQLTDELIDRTLQLPLLWKEEADNSIRGVYNKDSRTTIWRKRKENEKAAQGSKKIDTFFSPIPKEKRQEQEPEQEQEQHIEPVTEEKNDTKAIDSILKSLSTEIQPALDRYSRFNKEDAFHVCKMQAVYRYYYYLSQNYTKRESSKKAAIDIWIIPSDDYRAKAIRYWAKEYADFGYISKHQQGKHAKVVSLLSDESIKESVISHFIKVKVEKRTLPDLLKHLNTVIVPEIIGITGQVSHVTLWRYMKEWGYDYKRHSKQIYVDGHEREDVVAYRQSWAKRMMGYKTQMESYSGDDEEIVTPPSLHSGQKQIVMVTHDESTFYANDGKQQIWIAEGETVLRKKTSGQSIMVSEFQCACHGTMRQSPAWTSRTLFEAGGNREKWWTHEHMTRQLTEDAIPIFELLHPNSQALFIFDQSSNHNAYASDALRVVGMRKDSEFCGPANSDHCSNHKYRDGYYIDPKTGELITQSMYIQYSENIKKRKKGVTIVTADKQNVCYFKGVKLILEERGLWVDDDPYRPGKKWRMDCTAEATNDNKCCAKHLLASQPDFREQKTALCEAIEDAGHIFELYPKFHCECNWIERYWGAAKRIARVNCDYSFRALRENLPGFLDSVSPINETPTTIRRFFGKAWRFIDAYSQNVPINDAFDLVEKFSSRKYASHRRIGIHD